MKPALQPTVATPNRKTLMKKNFALTPCMGLLLGLMLAWPAAPALAGEGHSHDEPAASLPGQGPQRQADGAVFLPKPAQRQMGLRTLPVRMAALPRSVELNARVVPDPNAGGRVQAMVAGRLEAGPQGFPSLGQAVKKGQVLAWLEPAAGALERASQSAQVAELQAAAELGEKRLKRLRELSDTVPRKEIEALEAELQSLQARGRALSGGLQGREALRAPASGLIASANAHAGQVVEAKELVFEVVDPQRLRVEALAFDAALAGDVAGATLAQGGQRLALDFVGAGLSLRDQALPLSFKPSAKSWPQATPLVLGQTLKLWVQTRSQIQGLAVPAAALLRNPANQATVWVKTAPERFEPRVVQVQPLDGASVAVTAGLQDGKRVVSVAAGLLNQIR